METDLGNLPPTNPDEWQVDLAEIAQRVLEGAEATRLSEQAVETLFRTIVKGLADAGFPPAKIADFFNARVAPGSRLKYCDAGEVQEALDAVSRV